jgi:hypothetical protein
MGSIEDKSFFSNMGFRTKSAAKELTRLKEGKTPNLYILSNSYEILDYYKNGLKIDATSPTGLDYSPLLIKNMACLMKHPETKNILLKRISNAKKTKIVLEKIAEDGNASLEEIEEGIEFFEELSKKCKEYVTELSCP